ncbi:histidine phosphatase family protein [Zooshikella harenae]|uniref:Histidine phosphatase family protein n=1 Tax=Zooshikella harenae TaxID=2827238 RepID=A0ABS5ZGW9_9GAMM|nr:histidine phosphatase family protein [Zooshikella harenae]MBU2713028.1 histidine phosphatase family protein [Zooshikella harenae]
MLTIYCLRHGTTLWNQQRRIQGRQDTHLLPEEVSRLQHLKLSPAWKQLRWYSSPLMRAQQTAQALGITYQILEPWQEMDWGHWEGQTLTNLRQQHPNELQYQEQRGIHLHPTQGESPYQVLQRITQWAVQENAQQSAHIPKVIVTHKGVIRPLLAAATGWLMLDKYPTRLNWQRAHNFTWSPTQGWQLKSLNMSLSHPPQDIQKGVANEEK